MIKMITKVSQFVAVLAAALTISTQVSAAHKGFELGVGAGTSHALTPDDFKRGSQTGDANKYWLGYGFDKNLGVEVGLESYDFDGFDSKHQDITLSGVYTFLPQYMVHPLAKLGLGTTDTKDSAKTKTTSTHAKAAFGIEADFKYVSAGALFDYVYTTKSHSDLKNTSAVIPALFLTIHEALMHDEPVSKSEAPAPVAPAPVVKKDTDNDGVYDDEDKCPTTPSGVAVNAYGCALTEKASIKLQVEFANGKSVLDPKFDGEIKSLADFMAKYPNTNAEIAGHTDNTGKAASNKALSQKRADSVKAALIKAGVDAKRLTAKGYGPAKPIADNKTAEGRQTNRRVVADISVVTEKKK